MGTVINVITVIIGSLLGVMLQSRFPDALKKLLLQGVGLITVIMGVQMGLKTDNILIPMGGILLGGIIGYILKLDYRLDSLGDKMGKRFSKDTSDSRFSEGFVMASLIFCVGPLTILGSINDGLYGDYQLLAVKSVLDGFTSMALAASLGIGVLFSIITIIVVQGGLTLLAGFLGGFFSNDVINETTAAGGIIIIGLGIVILEIRKLNVADFLPAIFLVPVIVKIIQLFSK